MDGYDALMSCINGIVHDKVFYRKIFYTISDWIDNSEKNFLILTGPRKCGKSVCCRQISDKFGATYIDFKSVSNDDEKNRIMEELVFSSSDGIFVLDEITYLFDYPSQLARLANLVTEEIALKGRCSKKVIITGSQSCAINGAGRSAFATSAEYVKTSFIDFEEWLVKLGRLSNYGGQCNPGPKDYSDYLFRSSTFTTITDNLEYVRSCLEETIVSERKSISGTVGMVDVMDITAEEILSVMYAYLVSLHNKYSYSSMRRCYKGFLGVRTGSEYVSKNIKQSELERRIETLSSKLYNSVPKDICKIKRIVVFLEQIGLVTIREVTSDVNTLIASKYFKPISDVELGVPEFFSRFNVCVKHPMFYFNLIKELLYDLPDLDNISKTVIGSALECSIAGLLSYHNGSNIMAEYQSRVKETDIEVDIVLPNLKEAYEVTVSTIHGLSGLTWFDNTYSKYLISAGEKGVPGITNVFYPEFLLRMSRGLYTQRENIIFYV